MSWDPLSRSRSAFSRFYQVLDLSMSFSIILGVLRCSKDSRSDRQCSLLSALLALGGGGLTLSSSGGLLGDSLNLLLDGEASLLAVDHNLEALDVGEVGAKGSDGKLLGDGGLSPLGSEAGLLGGLDEGSSAGATLKRDLHSGQRQSLQRQNHSWEVLGINEHAVLVSDVDDGDHLSVVVTEVNKGNSASFNEVFVSLFKQKTALDRSEVVHDTQVQQQHVWAVIGVSHVCGGPQKVTYHFFFYITILNNNQRRVAP